MTTGETAPQPLPCGLCTDEPLAAVCAHHARGYAEYAVIVARRFTETCAAMRAGGQGLTQDQTQTLGKGMGLYV